VSPHDHTDYLRPPTPSLTDELRQAADILEKIGRLHGYTTPEAGEWSARQLRKEADYLDKPVMG